MALFKRFDYSEHPEIKLNQIQKEQKKLVESKIDKGIYDSEHFKTCPICSSNNFETIADKDRYGFKVKTVICKNCGLVFINPHFTTKTYSLFYNSDYRKLYEGKKTFTNLSSLRKGEDIYFFLSENLGKMQNKLIAEIGTGSGGILQVFKEKGNKVIGVDIDKNSVKLGRNNGVNLYKGDINQLIKMGIKADIVIYSHVLEHIIDLNKELINIRKILKPKGYIYVRVPSIKNLGKEGKTDFLKFLQNAHVFYFTAKTLENLFAKHGFKPMFNTQIVSHLFRMENIKPVKYFPNDYLDTINYLHNIEKQRVSWYFGFYMVKHQFIQKLCSMALTKKITRIKQKLEIKWRKDGSYKR